ncbi:2489_t:CDS:2, partial [Cetraspora pellucida]
CLTTKAEKKVAKKSVLDNHTNNDDTFIEIISIHKISDYIADIINNLEINNALHITFRVRLENISDITNVDVKMIAKLIVDEIEEGDDYNWIAKTAPNLSAHHQGVGNAYLLCSQSNEIKQEYKDSNRKRTEHFNCHEKLSIYINIPVAEAKITLHHSIMHDKPNEVTQFYKSDENHIISAYTFFERQDDSGCNLCFQLETDYTTALGFTMPILNQAQNVTELHCDAMYKTVKGHFELYGLVGNRQTDYPFLIWNRSESQNISENLQNLEAYNQVEAIVNNLDRAYTILKDIKKAKVNDVCEMLHKGI